MKIAIICSSLNPGRDGVGDYTRRLSRELSKLHNVAIFSLRDIENQSEIDGDVTVARFKDTLSSSESKAALLTEIQKFAPDFISLQVVPFGFNKRGLIKELIPIMSEIRRNAPLGIMFHELWLGEKPNRPFKHKLLGLIQKYYVLKALRSWSPEVIHTSNPLYQNVLRRHGYSAKILPLFGNIPIVDEPAVKSSPETLLPELTVSEDERTLLFPFSQSGDWHAQRVTEILIKASQTAGVSMHFVQVGKNPALDFHWPEIKSLVESSGHRCTVVGPTDLSTLSKLMLIADIGVSSAHIHLAGKSGGVVGMLEHGLPVLCTSWDIESSHEVPQSSELRGAFSIEEPLEVITDLLKAPKKQPPQSRLPEVSRQFAADIEHL